MAQGPDSDKSRVPPDPTEGVPNSPRQLDRDGIGGVSTQFGLEAAMSEPLLDFPGEVLPNSYNLMRQFVENSPFGAYVVDADSRVVLVSAGADGASQKGRSVIGRDFAEVLRTGWSEPFATEAIAHVRKTMETGEPYRSRNTVASRKDISSIESYDWRIDRMVLPGGKHWVVCQFYDLSERLRYEDALRESENRFRTMADNLPLIVWLHDAEGEQEFVNQTFCEFFSVTREEMRDGKWRLLMHPEDGPEYTAEFEACIRERRPFHHEVRVRRADGEWRWIESWATPRFDEKGKFVGHVGTSADITERKRSEEIRQLLVMELNHRVKNTIAVVQAIARQSLTPERTPEEQRNIFQSRLRAFSGANEILIRTGWERGSLGEIINSAFKACGVDQERYVARGPEVMLEPQPTVTMAMALHELCTNAIKHGALAGPEGRVLIDWQHSGEDRGRFRLVWTERGGQPVVAPERKGFGARMLERALATQLIGTVQLKYDSEGLTCIIEGGSAEQQNDWVMAPEDRRAPSR